MAYRLSPLSKGFGATVHGIDLRAEVAQSVVAQIKRDLLRHRLLVFKGQGRVSGERQIEISRWFGELHSTFAKHPRSPHPDVFRVSNDSNEGCTHVGRSGWHIDGTFLKEPFKVQTMHFWSTVRGGNTMFAPLKEVAQSLLEEERRSPRTSTSLPWDRLWFASDRRERVVHPLLCRHPETGEQTMCFHLGSQFLDRLVLDFDKSRGTVGMILGPQEERAVLAMLKRELEDPKHNITVEWEEGDFALVDNLALAHYAVPGTQASSAENGLRILHRTTVKGDAGPTK
mmetsp:Transcript_7352/g.18854  ORF Transcript_7352/g.18854 Transcript_7352/m.18854 type:complete len:285 (-) Transcript_7352:165-1019(-)